MLTGTALYIDTQAQKTHSIINFGDFYELRKTA
jgi:hypothetical protein